VKSFYFELDIFFEELLGHLPENVAVFVISDHGFDLDTGSHSDTGFNSSSQVLNPKPVAITDFYKMVIDSQRSQAL